jgi:acetyl esterase/lipase
MAFGRPVEGYAPPTVDVDERQAPGPNGPVRVRTYRPPSGLSTRGLVWMHGGAFMFGDLDMPEADAFSRELAARTGTTVVSVDYRLCRGGVHFPVPHDDVHAAFVWATDDSGLLPVGSPWAIGGASAGANLAAGVAQRLRDEGGIAPDRVVLAYPVVHDPVPPMSPQLQARIDALPPVLHFEPETTAWLNRNFLGEHPPDVPYAFAGLGDAAGLPPTYIVVCGFDDLLPSGVAYAEKLRTAGVEVQLEEADSVPHGHLNYLGLPPTLATIDRISAFLGTGG